MKKELRNPNRMQFQNRNTVRRYLMAKEERDNRLWRMAGSEFVTFVADQWITLREYERSKPILTQPSLLTNLDNPNIRKNYSV